MNRHVTSYLMKVAPDTEYGKTLRRVASELIALERRNKFSRFAINKEVDKEIEKLVQVKLKEQSGDS